MKPEAQRLALAKLDGWQDVSGRSGYPPCGDTRYTTLPDYLKDHEAIFGLLHNLGRDTLRDVEQWLRRVTSKAATDDDWKDGSSTSAKTFFWCASAAQFSEAILRATNLWTDDER